VGAAGAWGVKNRKRFGGKHLLPRSGEKGLLEPRKQIVNQNHEKDRFQKCDCSESLHIY
jgi:hypothetical protein